MFILDYLVHLVSQAPRPGQLLDLATRAIAIDLGVRSCRLFLQQKTGQLVLSESFGLDTEEQDATRARDLAREAMVNVLLTKAETPDGTLVAVPLVARARSLGALVIRRGTREEFAEEELSRLSAIAPHVVDLLESVTLIQALEGTTVSPPVTSSELSPIPTEQEVLEGMPASPGIAVGVVEFRHAFPSEVVRRARAGDATQERGRLRDALQKAENDLLRMQAAAASELGEEQALVFAAQLLLLKDPMLLGRIKEEIAKGRGAASAVDDTFAEAAKRLRAVADPYIQERCEDVEDLRSRLLGYLIPIDGAAAYPGQVVVSPRLSPSVIMELKGLGALGVATELGGTTSHGALLARALGVPAVSGVTGLLLRAFGGNTLIVDGDQGRVILRPSAETLDDYAKRAAARGQRWSELSRARGLGSQTADGIAFKLRANVALGVELDIAVESGAEGVGLYRTEFAFIARDSVPSRDEQVRIYAKVYDAFPNEQISFRVLDLAGDKFLSTGSLSVARSAFHGYRSIRVLFDYPHILRDQVQAFALAANGRRLRILIPMVSSLEELLRVKELVLSALAQLPSPAGWAPSFGAMIEVPAAVELVGDLAPEVDFFAIGTNDLIQYALVVDREDPRLSSPRHAFHPAIWRMLQRVVEEAHSASKEVSVCGEMAARPEAAIALVSLGVDSLSLAPRGIPELKLKLSQVALAPLRADLEQLLGTRTTSELENYLRSYLLEHGSTRL